MKIVSDIWYVTHMVHVCHSYCHSLYVTYGMSLIVCHIWYVTHYLDTLGYVVPKFKSLLQKFTTNCFTVSKCTFLKFLWIYSFSSRCFHRQDFYRTGLWRRRWVSYQKQECLSFVNTLFYVVRVLHLFFLFFCVLCFCFGLFSFCVWCPMFPVSLDCFGLFSFCVWCPMFPVSLDCPFLNAPSVFSNVHTYMNNLQISRDNGINENVLVLI